MADSKETSPKDGTPNNSRPPNEKETFPANAEPKPMVIKPHCECVNCSHWTTSTGWSNPSDFTFADSAPGQTEKVRTTLSLLRPPDVSRREVKISSYRQDCQVRQQANLKLLVHGLAIPHPTTQLSDTHFHVSVQKSLEQLGYYLSTYAQPFVWPALSRQLNVFLVNGPKCGKTTSYLPAVCSFALQPERYDNLSRHTGPLIVILCAGSEKCEEVYDLIIKLYKPVAVKPKIIILTCPLIKVAKADIVITTPTALLESLKSGSFNLKRLCHLVVEDGSIILKTQRKAIYAVFKVIDQMLEHRKVEQRVQLVVTSDWWTKEMENLLEEMNDVPLVCIGNLLEAALYGSVTLEFKFLMSSKKKEYLGGILQDNFLVNKTLVACHDTDLSDVKKVLLSKGAKVLVLSTSSPKEEIFEAENQWKEAKCGQYPVFICSDHIIGTMLSITDVVCLIHYSLPSNWHKFTSRFASMLSQIKSPLDKSLPKGSCKSFVMVDESSEVHSFRILGLLRRLNKGLTAEQQKHLEAIEQRKKSRSAICPHLKLHGKCPKIVCEYRHHVTNDDTTKVNLPQNGTIKFKILQHLDVTQYLIQIIEYQGFGDDKVEKYKEEDFSKPFTYEGSLQKADNLKIGKLYGYCKFNKAGEEYMLCRVVELKAASMVEVKLVETGDAFHTVKSKLYELPEDLKITEAFLCHLVPPYDDINFSARSFHIAANKLQQKKITTIEFSATVRLQLGCTLWLDNVAQRAQIQDTHVTTVNLSKYLQDLGVVKRDEQQMDLLHDLCRKCNVTMPQYVKPKVKRHVKARKIEYQEAFLEMDQANEVIFSSAVSPQEFYVRRAKFSGLLADLEQDMTKSAHTFNAPSIISVGKYYLAPDPNGDLYSRALILNTEAPNVLCFYVDYGDEAIVEMSCLRPLLDKFIYRLPFQAIQCSLHGVLPVEDEWHDDATSVLYKFLHEPESDIFRSLFTKVYEKERTAQVRTKFRYSVVLKDGFGDKNLLINKLLVECGFAKMTCDEFEDFELPSEPEFNGTSEETSEDEKWNAEEGEKAEAGGDILNMGEVKDEDFDVVIYDREQFFKLLGIDLSSLASTTDSTRKPPAKMNLSQLTNRESTTENGPRQELQSDPADEKESGYLTPDLWWSQNGLSIRIRITLIGVEDYQIKMIRRRMLYFKTTVDDRCYQLKITLHNAVDLTEHSARGQEVVVFLTKNKEEEWQQLTATTKRLRNIHYEFTDDQLKEPKPKAPLQLDITDSESDDEDDDDPENRLVYFDCSDLDSEYDQDLVSSDEN